MASPESRDEVIQRAPVLGYAVSPSQLARWHRAGLLPRPRQQALGRGRGTETLYPPGTALQVVAICQIKDEERRLERIAFRLWWEGFPVEMAVIREQLAAVAQALELGIRNVRADGALTLQGVLARSLGSDRIKAINAAVSQAASGEEPQPKGMPLEEIVRSWPPTLDEMAALLGHTVSSLAQASVASLVAQASDEDLVRARDRTRSMVFLLRNTAAPMAWLYGKSGAAFKMLDRAIDGLVPHDYLDMIALVLVFSPQMHPEVLAVLDAGTQPPLAHELRQILAIRDQVPGAANILKPIVIRALLRDKEAARRYQPAIEEFFESHREEIDAVLADMEKQGGPGGVPAPQSADPLPNARDGALLVSGPLRSQDSRLRA